VFLNISFAYTLDEIEQLYTDGKYAKVCSLSGSMYMSFKNNEKFLDIFADSCLQSDMINRMILPIVKLNRTRQARENAAYFTTILYQKKLLYYALCDNVDISYVNLPKTDYILSKIFDKFVKGEYELDGKNYWFDDDLDDTKRYKLSLEDASGIKKIYLRTYKDGKITKVRVYW
jgi:hypothetical protein